jgi:membrane-bound lytic murein transglycosylase F
MHAQERYDSLLQYWWERMASRYGFAADTTVSWQFAKALVSAESSFRPDAVSPAGAVGLMQLMPATAQELGVVDRKNPEENIWGGIKYLGKQWAIFRAETGLERWKFAVAAYNAGAGNIIKAQRLATAAGDPPDQWTSIARALPQVTGERNAQETVTHVRRVCAQYEVATHRRTS